MCLIWLPYIWIWIHYGSESDFVITLFIFLPHVCDFMENLFATHSTDRTYQHILLNEHHPKNYKNSLLNDITLIAYNLINMLWLNISEDFPAKRLNLLHEAERKLVNLLLEETKWVHQDKSSCPEVFCKKGVLTNFAKFTEKHLWQSLFLINFI